MSPSKDWYDAYWKGAIAELMIWSDDEGSGLILTAGFTGWVRENHPALYADMSAKCAGAVSMMDKKDPDPKALDVTYFNLLLDWMAVCKKADALYKEAVLVRRLAPPFLERLAAPGYSYSGEQFELAAERLEAWAKSPDGYGQEIPYNEFWAWFKGQKVYDKFARIEEEAETLMSGEAGPDERSRIDELIKAWDESVRWIVRRFDQARREAVAA